MNASPFQPSTVTEASDPARLCRDPIVSVVMLAYRHEACLAKAIESVVSQDTGVAYELLIGEDGSPDRTREIALAYQRTHPDLIRVIFSDQNVGTFENSRRLIHAARGRLIAFCEGDDYWTHPQKLQMEVEIFETDASVALVHSDFDRLVRGRLLRNYQRTMKWPVASGADAFSVLLGGNRVVTVTSMYRTALLREFAASGISKADWPFGDYSKSLYAALRGKVVHLPVSTAVYRHFPGSATARGRLARLQMYEAAHECREAFLELSTLTEGEKLRVLAASRKHLLSMSTMAGQPQAYHAHRAWLISHGYPPGRARHLLSLFLMRHEPALRMARFMSRVRKQFRMRARFGWI